MPRKVTFASTHARLSLEGRIEVRYSLRTQSRQRHDESETSFADRIIGRFQGSRLEQSVCPKVRRERLPRATSAPLQAQILSRRGSHPREKPQRLVLAQAVSPAC